MVDVLEDFHQELLCAECDGYKEEKPVAEEKKYPYTGFVKDKKGFTLVHFTKAKTGVCLYTDGHDNKIGETASNWAEEDFVPCL